MVGDEQECCLQGAMARKEAGGVHEARRTLLFMKREMSCRPSVHLWMGSRTCQSRVKRLQMFRQHRRKRKQNAEDLKGCKHDTRTHSMCYMVLAILSCYNFSNRPPSVCFS